MVTVRQILFNVEVILQLSLVTARTRRRRPNYLSGYSPIFEYFCLLDHPSEYETEHPKLKEEDLKDNENIPTLLLEVATVCHFELNLAGILGCCTGGAGNNAGRASAAAGAQWVARDETLAECGEEEAAAWNPWQ